MTVIITVTIAAAVTITTIITVTTIITIITITVIATRELACRKLRTVTTQVIKRAGKNLKLRVLREDQKKTRKKTVSRQPHRQTKTQRMRKRI